MSQCPMFPILATTVGSFSASDKEPLCINYAGFEFKYDDFFM